MTHTDWNSISNVLETAYKMNEKQQSLIVKVNQTSIRNLSEVLQALKKFSGVLDLRIEGMPFTPDIIFDGVSSLMNLDILFNRVLFFKQNCRPIKMTIRDCPNLQSVVLDSIEYDEFFYSAPIDLVIDNTPSLQSICCGRQGIRFKKFSICEKLYFLEGNCIDEIDSIPSHLKVLAVNNESCEFKRQLNSGRIYVKKSIVSDLMQLKYAGPGLLCLRNKDGNNVLKIEKEFTDELLKDAPAPVVKYLINKNVLKKKSLLMSAFSSAKAIAIKN